MPKTEQQTQEEEIADVEHLSLEDFEAIQLYHQLTSELTY